jgi:hypothetical protein
MGYSRVALTPLAVTILLPKFLPSLFPFVSAAHHNYRNSTESIAGALNKLPVAELEITGWDKPATAAWPNYVADRPAVPKPGPCVRKVIAPLVIKNNHPVAAPCLFVLSVSAKRGPTRIFSQSRETAQSAMGSSRRSPPSPSGMRKCSNLPYSSDSKRTALQFDPA